VELANGATQVDSDHTFTTGPLPQISFPAVKVMPAGLAQSGGVDLISSTGPGASAVVLDTDGSILWYYYDPNAPSSTYRSRFGNSMMVTS
jgi:hypothetical protein